MAEPRVASALYMPALHRGYVDFLEHPAYPIGILDRELVIDNLPRLERDIRALGAHMMTGIVAHLYPDREVREVSRETVGDFVEAFDIFMMPDEDVSRAFAERYLPHKQTAFITTFLRWDMRAATAEAVIPPDRIISTDELDQTMMRRAVIEGRRSPDWWRQVGALLVVDGEVIMQGHNRPYPTEHGTLETFGDPRSNFDAGKHIELQKNLHAEAGLVALAAHDGVRLEGADLYVSTFPCPPCAKSVAAAGIKRVFYREGYSLLDAEDVLRSQGVEIILVRD